MKEKTGCPERPAVVIVMEEGLVQGIYCDLPGMALVLDYDTEGGDSENIVSTFVEGALGDGSGYLASAYATRVGMQPMVDLEGATDGDLYKKALGDK